MGGGALCMLFLCLFVFFCNTPPTCNHHHRPLRYPNAQSTQCTLASSGRSWAAGSSFASPPWPSQAFPAAYQGQNSTGRFASEQPRSLASLARHRVRPAERQQHAVCPLHACDVGSMRYSLKLKLAVSSVMLDDDASKTLLETNVLATNQRAKDGCTHTDTHNQGRIHKHTHLAALACVASCWRPVASRCRLAARCSGVCCRRLAASLCRFARSLCVCVFWGGG